MRICRKCLSNSVNIIACIGFGKNQKKINVHLILNCLSCKEKYFIKRIKENLKLVTKTFYSENYLKKHIFLDAFLKEKEKI